MISILGPWRVLKIEDYSIFLIYSKSSLIVARVMRDTQRENGGKYNKDQNIGDYFDFIDVTRHIRHGPKLHTSQSS